MNHLNRSWGTRALVGMAVTMSFWGCGPSPAPPTRAPVNQGRAVFRNNDLEAALVEFQHTLELTPKLALANSGIDRIIQRYGTLEKAVQFCSEAAGLKPGNFDDVFTLAQVYHAMERFDEAVRAYLRAVELEPANFAARLNLGVCYHQAARLSDAIDCYIQAIQLDPRAAAPHINLGAAYDAMNMYDEAVHAYQEALALDSKQPMVLINLATAMVKQNNFAGARRVLQDVLDEDPTLADAYECLGYCLLRERKYEEALSQYDQASALAPAHPPVHAGLGIARMALYLQQPERLEYRQQALAHWRRSIELDRDQPRVRYLLDKYTLPEDTALAAAQPRRPRYEVLNLQGKAIAEAPGPGEPAGDRRTRPVARVAPGEEPLPPEAGPGLGPAVAGSTWSREDWRALLDRFRGRSSFARTPQPSLRERLAGWMSTAPVAVAADTRSPDAQPAGHAGRAPRGWLARAPELLVQFAGAGDHRGRTPLLRAAAGGYADAVELFLKMGADINAADRDGWNALHWAASYGYQDVVELLIKQGADPAAKTRDGSTPLHLAAELGQRETVAFLADKTPRDVQDAIGCSPLHVAAAQGYTPVVEALVAAGASINLKGPSGRTPLHMAAQQGHKETVAFLAARSVLNAPDDSGSTALHAAAARGHAAVVEVLIAAGTQLDVTNRDGRTALHLAAEYGHAGTVALLAATAAVNVEDRTGWTAAHLAAGRGHQQVVDLLAARGARLTSPQ